MRSGPGSIKGSVLGVPTGPASIASSSLSRRVPNAGRHNSGRKGGEVAAPNVQVQQSGAEGFTHNEINPDDTTNRMIQMWFVPDELAPNADYQVHEPAEGAVTRIYGGAVSQNETFPGSTEVGKGCGTKRKTISER